MYYRWYTRCDNLKGVDEVLDFLFLISFLVLAISFLLHSAAKGEMKKDHGMHIQPTEKMLKMQRTTRQLMGISGASLLILFAIVSALPPREKEPVATATEEVEEEADKEDVEDVDYAKVAKNAADVRDLESALKKLDKSVESVRLEGSLAIVRYDSGEAVWSENTMVKEFATDSTQILGIIKENPNYGDVAFERFGILVDEKGNERESGLIKALYFEEDINTINFDNFTDMVWVDVSKFYNNATGYAINGAIYTEIETELRYSMSWAKDPETTVYDVYF